MLAYQNGDFVTRAQNGSAKWTDDEVVVHDVHVQAVGVGDAVELVGQVGLVGVEDRGVDGGGGRHWFLLGPGPPAFTGRVRGGSVGSERTPQQGDHPTLVR